MNITEHDVVPCEDDQEFLLECWKRCLVKMIADVEETKRRWQDASQIVKAESLAAVAEARTGFSDALIKLEHAIEERLGRLRQLIDEKNGPGIQPYAEGTVVYRGQLVACGGSTFQALCDTGRAPPDEEHWICVAAGGLDGLSFRVRGTYQPGELYSRLDVVALNGGSFVARRNNPGACPGDDWQALCFPGKRDRLDRKVIVANAVLQDLRSRGAFSPHDLRRSSATLAGELGYSEAAIAKCLDHAVTKDDGEKVHRVTGVYVRSKRMNQKRAVLDGVAAELRRIIGDLVKDSDRAKLRLAA